MDIKNYNELDSLEIDILREVGSIGTGNAANSLSQLLNQGVRITLPEVRIMGYNEAIDWIGGPEAITAGVLVQLGG
jgi:chemotaxis protein CheC